MLVNCDVKGLEVVTFAELSGDRVLKQEIIDKVDIHDANRVRFRLGEGKSGRLVAKIFKFRLIYGGSAWSYAHDPDFTGVSTSEKFWQGVIDQYYEKYSGARKWHNELVNICRKNKGVITIPSGRYYQFTPVLKYGEWVWPLTKIKNYPVQGFGADLVKLARINFFNKLQASGIEALFIQTVHDSLVVDTPSKNVYNIGKMLKESVEEVPYLCREYFHYNFSLPLTAEITVGPNKYDLKEYEI